MIRRLAELRVTERSVDSLGAFHIPSLSCETIVYKGLLLPTQLPSFYRDLNEPDFESAIAMVHSRFSTNTFPTWDLAQPFTHICHNGEINTLQGNRNWMGARRSQLVSGKFGSPLERLMPIIDPEASDSRQLDQMLELLHLGGRSLPQAIMMMIPEAWEHDHLMDEERRAFYDYASALMEPWDGPAAIAFTDGSLVGATLDRNGLRPARYVVTTDDVVVLASETGVIDVPPENVVKKGRLQPGKIFVVDTDQGRIIDDDEVKSEITGRWPYRKWIDRNIANLGQLPHRDAILRLKGDELLKQQRAFGYTDEDLRIILEPMARDGKEPTGSMGNDAPLAVLSEQAPCLFNYFRQLFAQVTNPPIDPIREKLVMTLVTNIGGGGNTFEETPEHCYRLNIQGPVLTNIQLETVRATDDGSFEATTLPLVYREDAGEDGLSEAVERLCEDAVEAIDRGFNILVLSDRGVDAEHLAIPSLLATSAVHQHLVRVGIRMQGGLIVEAADVREVHHVALLVSYGAAAVNPWLALDTIEALCADGSMDLTPEEAEANYVKSLYKGLLKVMSKMGISTVASYRGAQIFEAVGLDQDLIEAHFTGTPSRIEGVGLGELDRENNIRHQRGFGPQFKTDLDELPIGGVYQWRRRGEKHRWNPATVARLQAAVRLNREDLYADYAQLANDESKALFTLRGLLEPDPERTPVPLEEVEPALTIAQRFCTGAMSFGSISAETHETLAMAMNELGGRSNSGEGGEEARRWQEISPGANRRSAIKQVASGRFGVHTEYLVNADELQIKMAQGAKPGEGGQLPGHKVSERIAAVRCSTPGVTLISPPPHHDIYSIEDLAQLIHDLKVVNQKARISVKLVSEVGVGTVAAGVAKAKAEGIVIAGHTGGTGASPVSSIKHAGLPWELGLAEAQQVLVANDLRGRVRLQVDGGLRTGRDVVIGALLGAEEFGFSTAPLVSLGCIMLRKCHLNTCSVGIATQDPELTERFEGKPEHVIRYFLFVAEEARKLMAQLGFRTMDEMIGRSDVLQVVQREHWKAQKLDLSPILARVDVEENTPVRWQEAQDHGLKDHLDTKLIGLCHEALNTGRRVHQTLPIQNSDRTVGAMLSARIVEEHGANGLLEDTITMHFRGSAGQSFGAFLVRGVTFLLEGDANDYVGKGLSGGRICVFKPARATWKSEENIIVGNTLLYGATSGEAYISGMAGERFAVRNSGARAVVEGVGDHGCEYMTGGVVVVLGKTGRNFAAGMSGGMAFVFDQDGDFRDRCNLGMVDLEPLVDESDIWLVNSMVKDHVRHTGSYLGQRIVDNWDLVVSKFVKVMPEEYKRVLAERRERNTSSPGLPATPTPRQRVGPESEGGARAVSVHSWREENHG